MNKSRLLNIGVFTHLSERSLESLEAIAKWRYIEKNAILHYEGESVDSVCLLASGKVELYKMDKNDNELFLCYVDSCRDSNRLINAFGSFKPYVASANVRAVEPSEVVLLELISMYRLVNSNVEIANAILSEILDKMIVFKNFINFKGVYDSTSRVAYLLKTNLTYFNQMQRQRVAYELGIRLETLSRILQKMLKDGLIGKDVYGNFYIKDMDLLDLLIDPPPISAKC